jgi:CubicO group peptidase (beta-lactamase class C family)
MLPTTADALRRAVEQAQHDWRAPAVAAGLVRDGGLALTHAVGLADVAAGEAPTADTQFRIGSITKTFTAVLVMRQRDAGRLTLDDRLDRHLPGTRHGAVTIRQLLTHLSGLQREPVGDVWYTLDTPDDAELLAGFELAEQVSSPHRRWHYSNLAFAVLGQVVARLEGRPWAEVLADDVLGPLEMRRTTLEPHGVRAAGYLTDPYADLVRPEPDFPTRALAPAAQLWSTVEDLGRWARFVLAPPAEVLAADTVEEMCHPHVMWDVDGWTLAWGLGFMLLRRGTRIYVGHEGAMPGFLAGLYVRRGEGTGAVALTNVTSGADPGALAADLLTTVLDAEPAGPVRWEPGPPVDPTAADVLGRWWSEGSEFVLTWTGGRLQARSAAPSARPPAVFVREREDLWRTESGREAGELLRVVRDPDGSVVRMHWATYALTREPRVFGATREGSPP